MTPLVYLYRMAALADSMLGQVRGVLREAKADPSISPEDYHALVYAARKAFFTPFGLDKEV